MKVVAITMITDPEHRQDPWKEGIGQMLEVFSEVVVVCGREADVQMVNAHFRDSRLYAKYLHWPQPEWSYEELPKHLNAALSTARELGADWIVRLDIDTAVHEKDFGALRHQLMRANVMEKWMVAFEKYQFFKPERCFEKGKMPLAIKADSPICYGFDTERYTDLCQPIVWDGKTTALISKEGKVIAYPVPAGTKPDKRKLLEVGVHVWNYDYTFKTMARAAELLYQFDRAHERFWGQGYSGRSGPEITVESAMDDFLKLSAGRWERMLKGKAMGISDHPKHFQESLRRLGSSQFGRGLWGKIVQK